ncbi:DLW-39 family protein [Rhodococcus aerolatus]
MKVALLLAAAAAGAVLVRSRTTPEADHWHRATEPAPAGSGGSPRSGT